MDFGLKGKVALITGSGRGIGKAEAMTLIKEGAKVAINDISQELCEKTVKEISQFGETKGFLADVTDEGSVMKMIDEVVRHFGTVHILVNNAGIAGQYIGKYVEDLPTDFWDLVIKVNLRSTFLCSKYIVPVMKNNKFGRIVNTSSMNAVGGGRPGVSNYTTAKSAISGLTRNMAKEVGKYGITVNAIAPGYVHTDMISNYPDSTKRTIIEQNPIGRFCSVDEVGALVTYLCSNQAAFINGAVISMDGGRQDFYWG